MQIQDYELGVKGWLCLWMDPDLGEGTGAASIPSDLGQLQSLCLWGCFTY